jgi:hypothetical protein
LLAGLWHDACDELFDDNWPVEVILRKGLPVIAWHFEFLLFYLVTHRVLSSASFTQETLLGDSTTSNAGLISATENASSSMAIEIVDLLRELTEINERIAASLSEADKKHGTAAFHAKEHHRGRLREYEKDFRTIKSNIEQAKAQAELLSTVRKDISAFKEGGAGGELVLVCSCFVSLFSFF